MVLRQIQQMGGFGGSGSTSREQRFADVIGRDVSGRYDDAIQYGGPFAAGLAGIPFNTQEFKGRDTGSEMMDVDWINALNALGMIHPKLNVNTGVTARNVSHGFKDLFGIGPDNKAFKLGDLAKKDEIGETPLKIEDLMGELLGALGNEAPIIGTNEDGSPIYGEGSIWDVDNLLGPYQPQGLDPAQAPSLDAPATDPNVIGTNFDGSEMLNYLQATGQAPAADPTDFQITPLGDNASEEDVAAYFTNLAKTMQNQGFGSQDISGFLNSLHAGDVTINNGQVGPAWDAFNAMFRPGSDHFGGRGPGAGFGGPNFARELDAILGSGLGSRMAAFGGGYGGGAGDGQQTYLF
jgi:hypothetical protein